MTTDRAEAHGRAAADQHSQATPANLAGAVLRATGYDRCDVDLVVHPADEMLDWAAYSRHGDSDLALAQYHQSGMAVASSLRQVMRWAFAPHENPTLLDFASGYGRITRYLLQSISPERIHVCEITPEAVAFQRRFGVQASESTARPDDLELDQQFDLVVATSLFTHLPPQSFHGWLAKLAQMTKPTGLLAFSTHDAALHGHPAFEGFHYLDQSESRTLDAECYGAMWVTERFVLDKIREVAPASRVERIARGIAGFQDLWVVHQRHSLPALQDRYERDAEGYLEVCRAISTYRESRLELSGWSALPPDGPGLAEVELHLGGNLAAVVTELAPRPDVADLRGGGFSNSGWQFTVSLPRTALGSQPLVLVARSKRGNATVIYAGSVLSAMLDATLSENNAVHARAAALVESAQYERWRAAEAATQTLAAEQQAADLSREAGALRERIAWMERSSFWQARNLWWAMRTRLGTAFSNRARASAAPGGATAAEPFRDRRK